MSRRLPPPDPRAIRSRLGLTQAELAYIIGTTRNGVASLERPGAKPCGVTLRLLQALAVVPDLALELHAIATIQEARGLRS